MKRKIIWGAIGAAVLIGILMFIPKVREKVMGFIEKSGKQNVA